MSRPDLASVDQPRRHKREEYVPRYRLDELFEEWQLQDGLLLAKHRIIDAFANAEEFTRGRSRRTQSYIVGLGGRQKHLADYVMQSVVLGRGLRFVTASELPRFIRQKHLKKTQEMAEYDLIAKKLSQMSPRDIWYNEDGTGTWEICQSLLDEYYLNLDLARLVEKNRTRLRRESLHGGGRLLLVH